MAAMPPRISKDEVAHVARLARLSLTDDELERFTGQLGAVLEHARDVESLDTAGVPPTSHPLPIRNVFRDDDPEPPLNRREVLSQAPAVEDDKFRVPRILGDEP
jgi:aspartyl-tRNA(Asn)/glutamyl-tRNA(Gln) amidotransferase subunit C